MKLMKQLKQSMWQSIQQFKSKENRKVVVQVRCFCQLRKEARDFAFVAKVQYGDTEIKTKAVNLNVSENVQEAIQEPNNLLIEKTEELNEETRVVEKTTSDGKVDVQLTEGMSGQIDENAQEEEKSEATSNGNSKEGNNVTSNGEELNAAKDTNVEIVGGRGRKADCYCLGRTCR